MTPVGINSPDTSVRLIQPLKQLDMFVMPDGIVSPDRSVRPVQPSKQPLMSETPDGIDGGTTREEQL